MCKSVRGAAFFGASVHSVVGIFFLLWFLFDTVVVELGLNLWKCEQDEPRKSFSLLPQYLILLFKFIYYVVLSITGIYMFRGVERASAIVIKYSLLCFVVLQTISLLIFVLFVLFGWEDGSHHLGKPKYEPVPTAATQFVLEVDNVTYITTDSGPEETALIKPTQPSITTYQSAEDAEIKVEPTQPEIKAVMPTLPEIKETTPVQPEIKLPPPDPTIGFTQRLTDGQLVSFVFEILGVVFNSLLSIIYTGILVTYMMSL